MNPKREKLANCTVCNSHFSCAHSELFTSIFLKYMMIFDVKLLLKCVNSFLNVPVFLACYQTISMCDIWTTLKY